MPTQHHVVFTRILHGGKCASEQKLLEMALILLYDLRMPTGCTPETRLPDWNLKSYAVQGRISFSVDFCKASRILPSYKDVSLLYINMPY